MQKITVGSLFAGIGGIDLSFENASFIIKWANEIDEKACKTYKVNFAHKLICDDVKNLKPEKLEKVDVLCAGFPCQPFSIAGYRQGFNDESGRGNLFFDIVKILKQKKPKAFLLENVKNFKTHAQGKTIEIVYRELQKLGYKVTDKVLNSIDYGNLPQNRERIYIVGFLDQKEFNNFSFPEAIPLTKAAHDCLENKEVDDRYYYNDKPLYEKLKNDITKRDTVYQWRRKYVRKNKNGVCPTLTANMGTGGHNVPLVLDGKGIRKITPRECANFQGFPKSYKLPDIADSHLYKQFGNSVSIPVVEGIARNIKIALIH